jgi:pimeloyl-ACP methyl ester carboxylesterase
MRVHVREWAPAEGRGAREPAIVLVHGNWSTWRWWIPLAAALPGRRLLAPDLRGRGDTEGPDHGYTLTELSDDLLALLDALELDRVHLVGHSLGSGVVMQFGLDHPERVASLVAIAPVWADGMPDKWAAPERQAAAHADRDLYAQMLRAMAPNIDEAELGELWQELVVTGHRQRPAATYRNLEALSQWRPGDELRALSMPRLVIDGELDPLCGGETARRAAEAMACERVQLQGIGHSPNLETPARVAELLSELFAAAESPS